MAAGLCGGAAKPSSSVNGRACALADRQVEAGGGSRPARRSYPASALPLTIALANSECSLIHVRTVFALTPNTLPSSTCVAPRLACSRAISGNCLLYLRGLRCRRTSVIAPPRRHGAVFPLAGEAG